MMRLSLGIDTGGTYTDAVLVDHASGAVVAAAKALTTRHDLAAGIGAAIRAVFAGDDAGARFAAADVILVALSTTLATNALAEGHGGAVCLLLIGYDRDLMRKYGFEQELATNDLVYLRGGHDGLGDEVAPLDEDAARAAILARRDAVEAFAVSGYFGVRNPAHELRVRALVEELTGLPVTCGHELTTQLNAVRRATTVALNGRLIVPLRELITSVQQTLMETGVDAPLMVVKGDGSLVAASWAARRPIETVLSGPAASVVGAWHLAGRRDAWIVDVGGTTTDIAALRDGVPLLNDRGACVGGWRTMVEAVDVHTTGLGGDSHVRIEGGDLRIGPRRAVPLCLLASEHPAVVAELRRQAGASGSRSEGPAEFIVLGRRPRQRLPEQDQALLDRLAGGPRSAAQLGDGSRAGALVRRRIADLEDRGLVRRAGFTPTDALHVLGRFRRWDADAAGLAAALLAAQAALPVEAFCKRVVERFSERVAAELVTKVLGDELGIADWEGSPAARALLQMGLAGTAAGRSGGSDLGCALTLRKPLVAVGAPVAAYLPRVAGMLHTELVLPEHADVANAIGAVSGSVIQRVHALISPLDGSAAVRVHLPDGVSDFDGIEPAVGCAERAGAARAEELARGAGADHVEVRVTRTDHWVPVAGRPDEKAYLGTELEFVAAGRPSPARR